MLNNIVLVLSYIGMFLLGVIGAFFYILFYMKKEMKKTLQLAPRTRHNNRDCTDPDPTGRFDRPDSE